jgi:hypothetical protein
MKGRIVMKSRKAIAAIAGLVFVLAFSLGGSAAPQGDKASLLGTWKVSQGVYSDDSLENELEMSFTFTETTLTNPMDGGELSYSLDQAAKRISASNAATSMVMVYRIVDKRSLEISEMRVTGKGKTTVIVGAGGMFKLLRLGRK